MSASLIKKISERKGQEWFAVKRSKDSQYQFYKPDARNRQTIEEIAPNRGNFEVITLIEIARLKAFEDALVVAVKALEGRHEGCSYMAHAFCNKCGKYVEREALRKIEEMLEKK